MKYLIVFIIFLSVNLFAQDMPVFEDPENNVPAEEIEPVVEPPLLIEPDAETTETSEPPQNIGSDLPAESQDFEDYQPSEEISEDLSVPFPVDI